jgi:uncharacterized membrane protein (UPF0127 family)
MKERAPFLRVAVGGREIARSRLARSLWEQVRGLMLAPPLPPGEALWLPECAAVHTAFVREAIDLVFIRDRRIVRIQSEVAPWRIALCPGANAVIELAGGEATRLGLAAGQILEVTPDSSSLRPHP